MSSTDDVVDQARILANEVRKEVLRMTNRAQASHVGSALSCVDLLAILYSGIANVNPSLINSESRDIIILSKGHAASALYATLAIKGFFSREWLDEYCEDNSNLGGHVTSHNIPGVELSTGSLGHGGPFGAGIALGKKLKGKSGHVYVIMSDGECDEGTTWEMALFANHHRLNNLTILIDRNGIQSLKSTEDTLKLEPLADKWKSFGWDVVEVDGHDFVALSGVLIKSNAPRCIIASTIKGKGVPFMENSVLWHYKAPTDEDLMLGLSDLEDLKN